MDNYQLFMVAERQNRIKNNNRKMKKLRFEIEAVMPKCKRILELKEEYQNLENNLENLDNEYLNYQNNEVLLNKFTKIQELGEQLQQKEEQLQFVRSLKDGYKSKKRISTLISSFKNYYKYKKQVAHEEEEQDISLLEIGYSYFKQCRIFKNNNMLFETEEELSNIVSNCELSKAVTLVELNEIEEQFDSRKHFLFSYPKKKEQMKIRMSEILSEIDQIYNSEEYRIYATKAQKYTDLYNENEIYQSQIDNMVEMTKVKPFVKRRKAA